MALDAISEKLLHEREDLVARADATKRNALEQGRDLNESEAATIGSVKDRVGAIDKQLAITTQNFALDEEVSRRISSITGAPVVQRGANPWEGMTAGQVLFDFLHTRDNDASAARVASWRKHVDQHNRAVEHMGTTAAATVPVAGGFGGLTVAPIVGPVIDLSGPDMPLTTAIGTQPSSNAMAFQRPRIVDPDLNTAAGPQAGSKEKAELPSKKFDVIADTVTLSTVGNYLNLSLQAETFVPGSLDIVTRQLNRRTSRAAENLTVSKVTAASKVITPASGSAADVQVAVFEAAAAVFDATGRMPEWIAAGPAGWAWLGGLTDLAGRPIFPGLNPANALGTANPGNLSLNIAGLQFVVTPGITDGSLYFGNGEGIELYLYRFPMLSAVEPSVLGRQLAVASALGSYQPPTTEAGPGGTPPAAFEGIVKLAQP